MARYGSLVRRVRKYVVFFFCILGELTLYL